jgi:beta-glucosidase
MYRFTTILISGMIQLSVVSGGAAQGMTETQADSAARSLILQMTLKEKVFEMHGHGVLGFGLSMIFSKKLTPVSAGGNRRLHIPATVFIDGPRGLFHYKGATAFPVTMARGASWDTDLEKRVGEAMGEEIRAVGGNYSGAVCMNLLRHPAWGRAQETYGEDPYHVGEMASALVDGIQAHNVQACAKHFAANSMENNRFGGSMNMDKRTLHEVYLPHFRKVVKHGVASIMSAYNKVNGEYCGHNKMLLTDILRNEWGFKGYVTSDWMYGLYDAKKGIEAGMNVEMPHGVIYKLNVIKKLLSDGKMKEEQIDALILPTIRTKLLFASRKDEREYTKELIGSQAHTALAREVAEKSAVLLKNENNILPFDKNNVRHIAVIGSLCDVKETGDHGSSSVIPAYIISPLEGIKNYLAVTGAEILTAAADDLPSVKDICAKADVVVIIAGTSYRDEGEYIGNGTIRDKTDPDKKSFVTRTGILAVGGDRKYLHLHQQDIDLIHAANAVNKKVVVSLVAGSAVTVEEWHQEVGGILETFYNGMEGGNALARILFGEVNPSGKLPFTVPHTESDLPLFDSYADSAHYGYYHGYTLFDREQKIARYPFGFGLSYTSFHISNAYMNPNIMSETDSLHISVKVKNTGIKAGAEVIQLYINFPQSVIEMPEKLLRGFKKIFLQPGEEQTVSFYIPVNELAFYNTEQDKWNVLKGDYHFSIGNSSDQKGHLTGSLIVK